MADLLLTCLTAIYFVDWISLDAFSVHGLKAYNLTAAYTKAIIVTSRYGGKGQVAVGRCLLCIYIEILYWPPSEDMQTNFQV